MANDDMPVREEEFESIPWSHLVEQTGRQPWLVYVAAAAVVALVVGVTIARSTPGSVPNPLDAPVPHPSTTTVGPALLTEADLRAPGAEEGRARAAVMRAEWFVRDYFTVDGAGDRVGELNDALGWAVGGARPDVTTYVEWARAWDVQPEEADANRYRVLVGYRSITGADGGFVRGSTRAVAVDVEVNEGGGTRVVDLPEPIQIPEAPVALPPPEAASLPEPVVDRALDLAANWGEPVEVVGGGETADGWRVVVSIADDHATPWPLAVHIEADVLVSGDGSR